MAGHRRGRRPREVVVEDGAKALVAIQVCVDQGPVEAGDRPAVHILMRSVAAVDSYNEALVTVRVGVCGGTAERFAPVGRETLAVVRPGAAVKRVAHHLVGEHPLVPGVGEPQQPLEAASGLIERPHNGQDSSGFSPEDWVLIACGPSRITPGRNARIPGLSIPVGTYRYRAGPQGAPLRRLCGVRDRGDQVVLSKTRSGTRRHVTRCCPLNCSGSSP